MMAVNNIIKSADIRLPKQAMHDDNLERCKERRSALYTVSGKYFDDIYEDGLHKLRSGIANITKHGIDNCLLKVLKRIAQQDDDGWMGLIYTYTGYTHADVVTSDGEIISYNAHPYYHGSEWYDWAYVHYAIEEEDGTTVQKF